MKSRITKDGKSIALEIASGSDQRKRHTLYFDRFTEKVRFCSCSDYVFRQRKVKGSCYHMDTFPNMETLARIGFKAAKEARMRRAS